MARVLVVDDNEELCVVLARLLRHLGHEAWHLSDGSEALDHLRQSPTLPDLLILDVMMPGLSGYDVLRALSGDPNLRTVPVVMYSALSDPVSRRLALEMGAREYLVKNQVTYDALGALVERCAGASA
jgi:putative two-component system response regulator